MSVLITGGSGTLGFHLLNVITKTKGSLISFSTEEPAPFRKVSHVEYEYGDLLDFKRVLYVLKKHKPREIYHIAAQSSVGISHQKPAETLSTNLIGTQNLLEAARQIVPESRILLLSSSEVYGRGNGLLDVLHEEDHEAHPITPFATSKACMEILAKQFVAAYGSHISIVRPFHYTGPFHSMRSVLPSVAAQLVRICENGGEPIIYTGNLDVSRDIVDVRDLSRALVLIMNTAAPAEVFNVCSGKARTIRELVQSLVELCDTDIEFRTDLSLERMNDLPLLVGSPEKLMKKTGWKPMISIEDSLRDLLSEMRTRIHNGNQ